MRRRARLHRPPPVSALAEIRPRHSSRWSVLWLLFVLFCRVLAVTRVVSSSPAAKLRPPLESETALGSVCC